MDKSWLTGSILLAVSLAALGSGSANAQQALRGKSVAVTWTEQRMQRQRGDADFHAAVRQGTFSAYISSAGRIFNRLGMAKRRGSGSLDHVGGGGNNKVTLSGRTMTAIQQSQSGGARRILITFDESLTSCTAQVIRGKASGADKIVARSLIRGGGPPVEIASIQTGGESCSVREGNVFGEQ
jgi:hypothetical protein